MSIDLGTPALEIAIALSFVFFLLSLIVTACTETVSWVSKRRSADLVKGIEGLLGTEDLVGKETVVSKVLAHPLVQSDVTTPATENKPSYVSARNFALALIQTVHQQGETVEKTYEELKETIEDMPSDSPLGSQLQALLANSEADAIAFRESVETWFNDAMDRVSGWYKRWSQTVTIGIAILVTVSLNASAIRIVERLAAEPAVRTAVISSADAAVKEGQPTVPADPKEAGQQVEAAYAELEDLKLPLMWSGENVPWASPQAAVLTLIGWLITIAAISLGAPFWFDSMSKLSRLRTTGKKPEEEPQKT